MSMVSDERRLWTIKETAEYFSVTEKTVGSWRRRGLLTPKYLGRNVRFDRDEILSLLRSTR